MLEQMKKEVYSFLENEDSGHDSSHIQRVYDLAMKFAKEEKVDETLVGLIALLHDVDDYKIVSEKEARDLTNATRILNNANVSTELKNIVLSELKRIGYSKVLEGIRPITIEGKIVSDADMCDASGVNGFIRTYKYNLKHGGGLFDRNVFPTLYSDAEEYRNSIPTTAVNHLFEKILKLSSLMLTDAGKKEALKRENIIVDILYNLFEEENAEDWKEYLKKYLKER